MNFARLAWRQRRMSWRHVERHTVCTIQPHGLFTQTFTCLHHSAPSCPPCCKSIDWLTDREVKLHQLHLPLALIASVTPLSWMQNEEIARSHDSDPDSGTSNCNKLST